MKKYKVQWYVGHIPYDEKESGYIDEVLNEVELEAESIDKVDYLVVLPVALRRPYYTRNILLSDTERVIDYGSHVNFIYYKEIK